MAEYKIENYKFNSKREYDNALKEYNYIKALKNKYNVNDPAIARKILIAIEKGSISFSTQIGTDFIKTLKNVQEVQKINIKKQKKKKGRKKVSVGILIISIFVLLCLLIGIKNESLKTGTNVINPINQIKEGINVINPLKFSFKEYNDGYYITGIEGDNYDITEIVFPSIVDGHPVVGLIGNYADYEKLKTVIISDGIKYIGEGLFKLCESIEEVNVPDSVVKIGSEAFGMTNIRTINIPQGIKSIERATFANCTALEKVEIPEGVTLIDRYAFASCINLQDIVLPESLVEIGEAAFQSCSSLTDITIPKNVDFVPKGVFHRCSALTGVTFESVDTGIWNYGIFQDCNTDNITIYGYSGSYAEGYAYEHDMKFVDLLTGQRTTYSQEDVELGASNDTEEIEEKDIINEEELNENTYEEIVSTEILGNIEIEEIAYLLNEGFYMEDVIQYLGQPNIKRGDSEIIYDQVKLLETEGTLTYWEDRDRNFRTFIWKTDENFDENSIISKFDDMGYVIEYYTIVEDVGYWESKENPHNIYVGGREGSESPMNTSYIIDFEIIH